MFKLALISIIICTLSSLKLTLFGCFYFLLIGSNITILTYTCLVNLNKLKIFVYILNLSPLNWYLNHLDTVPDSKFLCQYITYCMPYNPIKFVDDIIIDIIIWYVILSSPNLKQTNKLNSIMIPTPFKFNWIHTSHF